MQQFGRLWAGDQGTYEHALTGLVQAMAMQASGKPPIQSSLLSLEGNVGVIHIEGSLIPGEAGWMSMFGVTGYGDIRNAAIEAASNPDVKAILLAIDSGGGAVNGCADCAGILKEVGAIKPMLAYADGSVGSAAYWIASQAETILVGSTTIAGSIGVILKHSEMSKMRADAGITDTVIRSGDFKQLANSMEPLSPEGKAELQTLSDDINKVFVQAVADGRGMTAAAVDSRMGKGREFVGAAAVKVGLADGISTYEGALLAANAAAGVDNTRRPPQNAHKAGAQSMKKTLSAADYAAIASGAVIEASAAQQTAEATAEDAATTAAAAATAAEGTDPAATAEATAAAAEAATVAAAATNAAGAAAAVAVEAEGAVITFLRGEIATMRATETANAVAMAGIQNELTASRESMPKLLTIARDAVGKMKVALGGSAAAAETMTAVEVIAAHSETSDLFIKKFKVGGAAATSASTEKKETPAVAAPNHLFLAASRSANAVK